MSLAIRMFTCPGDLILACAPQENAKGGREPKPTPPPRIPCTKTPDPGKRQLKDHFSDCLDAALVVVRGDQVGVNG